MNKEHSIKILDCTLRDGGYINNWKWGYEIAKTIIKLLTLANVDIIEVGFLRNTDVYDKDISVCNSIEELNQLLPVSNRNSIFSAMAMQSNYSISKLNEYSGEGIELIRVTFHDYDIQEGLDFVRGVQEKGYKVSVNPINIMGYTDRQLIILFDQISKIHPYQFSIVDTFGSMRRKDLDRIVSLVDHNLDKDIRVGLHLHENMALSYSLAQDFLNKHIQRNITVDASLSGMGRIPGNLPTELLADYVNENYFERYDIDYMLDAIQEYIKKYHGKCAWGYTPEYFLSARYNLHRNYAEYYLSKGDLTSRDINHILSKCSVEKRSVFDKEYANELYENYINNIVDDKEYRKILQEQIKGKTVCIVAPGSSIEQYEKEIIHFIQEKDAVVFTVNFMRDQIGSDYVFYSSSKRYETLEHGCSKIIVTSNVDYQDASFIINYNSLYHSGNQGANSLVMLIHLLKQLGKEELYLAGADGYCETYNNYFDRSFQTHVVRGKKYNMEVAEAMRLMDMNYKFLTPSQYQEYL